MPTELSKRIGIVSVHCNFHAEMIATHVFGDADCYYKGWHYGDLQADGRIPYVIGFYSKDKKTLEAHYNMIDLDPRSAVTSQPPAIIHWVGTDIINAQSQYEWGERRMFEKLSHSNIIHLVHLDEHLAEMKEVMPQAHYEIVSLPPYRDFALTAFPEDARKQVVSVYMPTQRREFFRYSLIVAAAKKFPNVRFEFYYYGDAITEEEPLADTINCFRVPARDGEGMKEQVRRSKLFLRIPAHDGLSVQVLEFATAGRSVIYNKDMPHLDHFVEADSFDENLERLVLLIKKALARSKPNEEMADYYRTYHSREKYLFQMAEVVKQLTVNEKQKVVYA